MATLTRFVGLVAGGPARVPALTAALVAVGLWLLGPGVLADLPRGLFTLLLACPGAEFHHVRLRVGARRTPWPGLAIVLLLLAVAAFFGFPAAVGVGVASIGFTLSHARVGAVRAATTGRLRRSSVERSRAEAQRPARAPGDRPVGGVLHAPEVVAPGRTARGWTRGSSAAGSTSPAAAWPFPKATPTAASRCLRAAGRPPMCAARAGRTSGWRRSCPAPLWARSPSSPCRGRSPAPSLAGNSPAAPPRDARR